MTIVPLAMEMSTTPNSFKPVASVPRMGGRDKGSSKTYSSSEDDFHSDDNLRPYEEVKTAHQDKKLNGLGVANGNEYMSTALTPLMDPSTNVYVHRKISGRTPSTTSNSSKGRLYSYVSGSDGDDDDVDTSSSSRHNNKRRHWRKGSPHSTVSSSNDFDTAQMRNDQVSQLSLSDSDDETRPLRYTKKGTMPPPSSPPPPPPPIEDIPQRLAGPTPAQQQAVQKQHQQLLQQQQQQQQHRLYHQFGPHVRGNYSDIENLRRGNNISEHECVQKQYSDPDKCSCKGGNHYSEGDISDYEPHFLVQTSEGNVLIPQSQVLGSDGQPHFPRAVPRSGSIPVIRLADLPGAPGLMCHHAAATLPQRLAPEHTPGVVIADPRRLPTSQDHEYHEAWDTQAFVHPHQYCASPTSLPYTYPGNPTQPQQQQQQQQQEFVYCTKTQEKKKAWKDKLRHYCSWRCSVIILVILLIISLGFIGFLLKTCYANDAVEVNAHASARENSAGNGSVPCSSACLQYLNVSAGALSTDRRPSGGSTFTPPTISIAQYRVGETSIETIPPKSFWKSQFTQTRPEFVRFNISLPDSAILGVYGRRGAAPSLAQFDFFEVFQGSTLQSRAKRAARPKVDTALHKYLESGIWYLYIYNDGDLPQTISLKTDFYDPDTGCPQDCHGHGGCHQGQCMCYPGYTGWDCLQNTCPVLCSGNGMYIRGMCQCHQGWKGRECEIRENECEVPNCNGNGQCIDGKCVCHPGFQGPHCGIVDCLLPNCSGNGVCALGRCICFKGFTGTDCSIVDKINITHVCAKDCSGHGQYNVEENRCECERLFTGLDCETEICRLACVHGYCQNQKCNCDDGWRGALCDELRCDARCNGVRGYCHNGTCVCLKGWNGKHCSLDGCPDDCSNNGLCKNTEEGWSCQCRDGWKGMSCGIPMETSCKDHTDNDEDGLRDCLDPDCCARPECTDHMYCQAGQNPRDILLRKQSPSTTASFFDKMKFLVEENSVQVETSKNAFNESQVSVIRGRVTAQDGTPLVGVRVDIDKQPLYGHTRTRDEGLFDVLVNGGGSVTLQFSRQPFMPRLESVLVPWNQIITMETVVMVLSDEERVSQDPQLCAMAHDHYNLQPVVLSTWQHTQLGSCPERSTIIPESQVLQESINIPGTSVNLVYHSSENVGYRSVILIQMTPKVMPAGLVLVHLRVSVEGNQFETTFEADPELKYTYAWDRCNAYRQKVYGIVPVRVNVGYQYNGCNYIFWESRSTTMSGFDLTSSEIGHWNVDIHHTYNFQEGILHKGDGTNIYMKEKPKKLISILGSGQRRRSDCDGCNGPAKDNRLLAPISMASSRDGSLYVWDYNFIRKLSPSREAIASILQMGTYTSHKPYMTVSPVDSRLYISDYMKKRVIQVKTMGPVRDLDQNYEVVAGTGQECTPGERDLCGDGQAALLARFTHPKGIAINKDGVIYVADGANIRKIDAGGIITTVIGSQAQPRSWKPMACNESLPADEVRLHWPTALAIDPLDDSLHILDDNLVLKLTKDNRVVIIAGRPLTCPQIDATFLPTGVLNDDDQASSIAAHVNLVKPEGIAFGPNGDLYIIESDGHHINRVRLVTTDGRIHHFAGTKSKCDCQAANCQCYDPTETSAAQALFEELAAITVTPDGIVHFADSGNLRVFSVISELPQANWLSQFEVVSTETKELYIFNRYGQHQHTVNMMTDQYMYNFTYSVNSYNGKLTAVTDNAGKSIQIERDFTGQAKEIISPTGEKSQLSMDNIRRLQLFLSPDNASIAFTYNELSGLLESKQLSDEKTYKYTYDNMGRLLSVWQPTGEITHLHTDVNATGSIVHVTTDNSNTVAMATYGSVQSALHGSAETKVTYLPDGAVIVMFPSNLTVALETGGNPILENSHRMHFKRKVIAPNKLVHRLEWRFYLRRKGRPKESILKLGRKFRVGEMFRRHESMIDTHEAGGYKEKALLVNGANLLTIEYDRDTHTETILDKELREIITTAFDNSGLPTHFLPARNHNSLNVTYNTAGEVIHWKYGDLEERRIFDQRGLLKEKTGSNGAQFRYNYRYGKKPTDIILPSGLQYYLQYDDEGNLLMVRTPGLGRHFFKRLMISGAQRFVYEIPNLELPYVEDYNGNGDLLQVMYPSECRKIIYRYNHFSQPTLIMFGETEVSIVYNMDISMRSMVEVRSPGYRLVTRFEYESSLTDSCSITFPDDFRLLTAKFNYLYDRNFRLTSIQGSFSQNLTTSSTIDYDESNGLLKQVKYLKFEWPLVDREKVYDEHVLIARSFDNYGRMQDVQYTFKENVRFKLNIVFDDMNRIFKWSRMIGQTDVCELQYSYDIDGNMIEVREDGKTRWQYGYDNNGNINKIIEDSTTMSMEYDVGDKIRMFGQRRYKFDMDGFMIQRQNEDLLFNAKGQLVSVTRSGLFKILFDYDDQDRVVVQRDRLGNIMQYFYADISNPKLITHTFNHSVLEMTQYFYDAKGRIIAFERQNKLNYVASDPMGSPIVIFDESGYIIKQVSYDPLGQIISDSNPNYEFSFGFQGGIYNPTTRLVHYGNRVYDTMIGHYIEPHYHGILQQLEYVMEDPIMMNNYQHRYLINTHLKERTFPTLDITEWLKLLGFDLESLAPNVGYNGLVRPKKNHGDNNLLPTSSAFECTFQRDMHSMLSTSTVPQSRISPIKKFVPIKPAPQMSIFGHGVILSVVSSDVYFNHLENIDPWSKKLISFLNGSKMLDLRYTINGRDIMYMVKPDASSVNEDLRKLGVRGSEFEFPNGINVTVDRLSEQDGYRLPGYEEVEVIFHGNHSVIKIRYGSNYDQERERILRHAKKRAIQRAWRREKWLLQNSLPTYHSWTDQEAQEILTSGEAEGFQAQFIHKPEYFPELADDCNNVKFVKKR